MISVIKKTDNTNTSGATRVTNLPGARTTRGDNPSNHLTTSNLAVSKISKNQNYASTSLGSDTAVAAAVSSTDTGFTRVVSKAEAQQAKAAVKAKKAETVPQRRPSVATVTTTASTKTTSTVHKAAIVAFSKAFVQSTLPPTSVPAAKKGKVAKTAVKLMTVDDIKATLASTIGWEGARVQSVDITVDEHDQDGVKLSKVHFIEGPAFLPSFRRAYTEVFGKVNVSFKVVTTESGKKFLNIHLKPWEERKTAAKPEPESKPEVATTATTESSNFPSLGEQSKPQAKQWGPKAKAAPVTVAPPTVAPPTVAPATELTALQAAKLAIQMAQEMLAKAEQAEESKAKVEVTKPQPKAKVEVAKPQPQPKAKVEVPQPKAKVEVAQPEPKAETPKPEFKQVLTEFSKTFVQSMLPPVKPTGPKAMTREQIAEKLKDSSWAGFGVASQNVTDDEHKQDGFTLSKAKLYNGDFFKSGIRRAYTELFGKVNVSYRVVESNGKKYLNVFVKPWVQKAVAAAVEVTCEDGGQAFGGGGEATPDEDEEDQAEDEDEVDEDEVDEEQLSEQASILAKAEQQLSQQQATETIYTLPGFSKEQMLLIQQMPKEMLAAMLSQAASIHQATPQQVDSQQVTSQQVDSQQVTSQQVDQQATSQQVDSQQVDQQATSQQVDSQQVDQQVEADSVPSSPVAAPVKTVLPNKPGKGKKGKNKGLDHSFFDSDPELRRLTLAQVEASEEDEVPAGQVGKTPVAAPPSTVQPEPQSEPQPEPQPEPEKTKKGSKKAQPSKLNFLTAAMAGTSAAAKLPSAKVSKNSYKTDLSDL
jgi:hypothetical protein